MKKLILLALLATPLAFISCKKDYDCNCHLGSNSYTAQTYENVRKSEAEEKCEIHEDNASQVMDGVECSIEIAKD